MTRLFDRTRESTTTTGTGPVALTNPSSITYTSNAAATVPGAPTIGTAAAQP